MPARIVQAGPSEAKSASKMTTAMRTRTVRTADRPVAKETKAVRSATTVAKRTVASPVASGSRPSHAATASSSSAAIARISSVPTAKASQTTTSAQPCTMERSKAQTSPSAVRQKVLLCRDLTTMARRAIAILDGAKDTDEALTNPFMESCTQIVLSAAGVLRSVLLTEDALSLAVVEECGTINEWIDKTWDEYIRLVRQMAKVTFCLADVATHDRCFGVLSHCQALLEHPEGCMITLTPAKRAECLRQLSSSLQYCGAQLYAKRQFGHAVRFLRAAAETASSASRQTESGDGGGDGITLKRWEQVAYCYRLASQSLLAEQAYREAIRAVPRSTWQSLVDAACHTPIRDLLQGSSKKGEVTHSDTQSALGDVGQLVKTVLELQTFELLWFEKGETTILDTLDEMLRHSWPGAYGALLEMCLDVLDATMHRDESPKAFANVVERLVGVYDGDVMPLRRARVLLRKWQSNILQSDNISSCDQQNQLAVEVEELLHRDALGDDGGLQCFQAQYCASLHITLAQRAAFNVPSKADMVHKHLESAVQHLDAVLQAPHQVDSTTNEQRPALRQIDVPSQRQNGHPRTPKNRASSPILLSSDGELYDVAPRKSTSISVVPSYLDDAARLVRQLEWARESQSLHGDILLTLQLTKSARQVALCLSHDQGQEHYMRLSTFLLADYTNLGKKAAADKLVGQLQQLKLPHESAWARFKLAQADLELLNGDHSAAMTAYEEAVVVLQEAGVASKTSGMQAALARIRLTEDQAMAMVTYARIQLARGQSTSAVRVAVEAVRTAMKGGMLLARLSSKSGQSAVEVSPFVVHQAPAEAGSPDAAATPSDPSTPAPTPSRLAFSSVEVATLHSRMASTLHTCYLLLGQIHIHRGSARDAEALLTEGVQFAHHARVTAAHAQALLYRAQLRIQMGMATQADEDAQQARAMVSPQDVTAQVMLSLVEATRHVQAARHADTVHSCEAAFALLNTYDEALAEDDGQDALGQHHGIVLSTIHTHLLDLQAQSLVQLDDVEAVDRLLVMLRGHIDDGQLFTLQGHTAKQGALQKLKRDPLLDLLPEAVLSMPAVAKTNRTTQTRPSPRKKGTGQDVRQALEGSVAHFSEAIRRQGAVAAIALREATKQRTLSQLLLSALPSGTLTVNPPYLPPHVTLERELEHCLEGRLTTRRAGMAGQGNALPRFHDDAPRTSVTSPTKATLKPPSSKQAKRIVHRAFTPEEESSEGELDADQRAYWQALRDRRLQARKDENALRPSLPSNWTVVSINLDRTQQTMLMSRLSGDGSETSTVNLPVDRMARRAGHECTSTIDRVLEELSDIITESDQATHAAHGLEALDARKAWWQRRMALDARMKALLVTIEEEWLAGWRSVLLPMPTSEGADQARQSLRSAVEAALQRACQTDAAPSRAKAGRDSGMVHLAEHMVDRLCTLATFQQYRPEDLEDIISLLLETMQVDGVPMALDEIDMVACTTDLQAALHTYRTCMAQSEGPADMDDHHLILLLDREAGTIPWESLPCLRGRAVCRIPSMDFLYDRLALCDGQGRLTIPARRARKFYLLNPSQELVRTQQRFLPFLEAPDQAPARSGTPRWQGIVGRAPTLDQLGHALETYDLVLYFGHGGAEQYLRASRLRGLMRCAVTMLWGCSSGALRRLGQFDATGTPYNYLLAGCPSLVANLWDATDKELDGISEAVMRKFGLLSAAQGDPSPAQPPLSLAQAVAQSRDACKLPYLTGAACVVYGIPVYYQ